jgi:hypothetical protein
MNWAVPAVAQMASLMPDSVFDHAVSGQNETGAVFPDWMMRQAMQNGIGQEKQIRTSDKAARANDKNEEKRG